MGESRYRFRSHRRSYALAAALVLPLASLTTATALPHGGADTTALASGPITSRGASSSFGASAAETVSKQALQAADVNGHTPVVVGTVRERVAQVSAISTYDLPAAALAGYRHAEASVAISSPGCHLSWTLLAAIGQVESDNGRYGGAVVLANGDTSPHILGPVLNGAPGMGAISDSDNGQYDGDVVWDRAVGPMQFIPGTWAAYGADGNGDGVSDPNNIKDAALAAAHYLCASGGDLRVTSDARAAVLTYNHSEQYVDLVLRLAAAYAAGNATIVPNGTAASEPKQPTPPVNAPTKPPVHKPAGHQVPPSGPSHGGGNGNGNGGSGNGGGTGGGGNGGGGGELPPITPIIHKPVVSGPPAPPVDAPPPPVTGELVATETGWSVGDVPLDFGLDADLKARVGDFNGDGRTQTLTREVNSLVGQTVIVSVVAADDADPTIDASPTTETTAVAVTPVDAPADDATPISITVTEDGEVSSINGIAYVTEGD